MTVDERRQERKVVTVVFADLVGFTGRAEAMDPEDVAALLARYHGRIRSELERYGGTVEKFIGDAAMALFGAPVAHEDDPERAVRAALAIRDWAREEGIEVRVGINTGEALVTLAARPEAGETMAAGDVVNTAARLQAAAPVGGILVGETTYRATQRAIDYREARPVEAKGKAQPVPAWEAVEPRTPAGAERAHEAPFVGRDRELELLRGAFARALDEASPQLVTLMGVPGIGKSRLVHELELLAGDAGWLQGRCLAYGDGVTFWALSAMVKAHLEILESDSREEAEAKLHATVADPWLARHLRPIVGLGEEAAGERAEAFAAWRRFLEGIAEERPLALVFEDLHWADDGLLDFVDELVDWVSGVPLLVLATARPELLDRRPAWGGGKPNALTISLPPLSDTETTRLLGALLQRPLLLAEQQEELLARAGGNPLYAEQFVRMLRERATSEGLPLPETVHGIVAARLDLLEPEQKALLQDAAVIGRGFWPRALAAISLLDRREIDERLHALARRELVRRERQSAVEGETQYAFAHLLVRDVAYGQIPRAERAEKHRLAAAWIESLGRREDHAEMLAHHYVQALELTRAAGGDPAALAEPARRALRDAGDRAMALNAHAAACRFYERAVELAADADAERAQLPFRRARAAFFDLDEATIDLLEEARDALLAAGEIEAAAEAEMLGALGLRVGGARALARERAAAAAELLEGAPPSREKAYVVANRARLLAVDEYSHQEAIAVGREALAMAQELCLPELEANALNTIGLARVEMDDPDGLADLEESLRIALEQSSPFEVARIYNNLGFAYFSAGQTERGSEMFAAQLETAESFGLRGQLRWAEGIVAFDAFARGRWAEALGRADEFLREGGSGHLLEPSVRSVRAWLLLACGDAAGAAADAARALELRRDEGGVRSWPAQPLAVSAQVALAAGRRAEAEQLTDELVALGGRDLRVLHELSTIELAWLLVELGRAPDVVADAAKARPTNPWLQIAAAAARGELVHAADRLGELGVPPLEARARLYAAEQLAAAGRREEADEQLQRALAFYGSVGASYYIRRAEAVLAATA